jgi:hypothetical protein
MNSGWPLPLILIVALAAKASDATPTDEPLDPQAAAFFATATKPVDTDNATIGLFGLSAPPGVDFMQYGRTEAKRIASGLGVDPNGLQVAWPSRVGCWSWSDPDSSDKTPDCASLEEAIATVRENATMLDRYREVQRLPAAPDSFWGAGSLFISMVKLSVTEMKIDSRRGHFEDAYRKWADHHAFLQRMCSVSESWLVTAVCLVNEGLSLYALEPLLWRAPQLIDVHAEEFLRLLESGSGSRYNLPGIMRSGHAEVMRAYETSDNKDFLSPNYITNRYYRYATRVMELAENPESAFDDFEESGVELHDPQFWPSARFLFPFIKVPRELIKSMHSKDRQMRLLATKVRIVKDKVGDDRIADYLAANAGKWHGPASNAPVLWDPARRVLYFENTLDWQAVRL